MKSVAPQAKQVQNWAKSLFKVCDLRASRNLSCHYFVLYTHAQTCKSLTTHAHFRHFASKWKHSCHKQNYHGESYTWIALRIEHLDGVMEKLRRVTCRRLEKFLSVHENGQNLRVNMHKQISNRVKTSINSHKKSLLGIDLVPSYEIKTTLKNYASISHWR